MQLTSVVDAAAVVFFATVSQIGPSVQPEGLVGVLIGGLGFAAYWIIKAFLEVKSSRVSLPAAAYNNGSSPLMWAKLQELLDSQKATQEALLDALKELNSSIVAHDTYVREHVSSRGPQIAEHLAGVLAPHMVNSVRAAFEAENTRKLTKPVRRGRRKSND